MFFRLVSSCHGWSWCTSLPALPSYSTLPSSLRWFCPGGDWQCFISLQSTGAQYFHRFDILGSSHQWWHLFIFLCLAYCECCHLCQAFDNTVCLAGYLIFALSLITIIYVCHLNKHPHRLAGYTTGVALSQYRAAGSCNQVGLLGTCAQSLWLSLYHSTI